MSNFKKILTLSVVSVFLTSALAPVSWGWQWPWSRKKQNQLTLQGSTTVLPIAQSCAEEFMKAHPEANISVRGGGSGVGIAALIDGTVDIANASRAMKTKELKKARAKGVNPVAHVVAKDAIAVVVHPENPVNGLTKSQLKAIYTGAINRWSEVGGTSGVIVVVSRDVNSGTFEVFNKLALDKQRVRPDALMQASNKAVATIVASTKGAIGYVGLGYLSKKVKPIAIDEVMPSVETAKSGTYPLARPLYMYTNGEPKGLAKEFIDFVLSPKGQKIVKARGFVPVK
ncbi:MAG: phosphate ABC transporter substrate-binding protein [Candidatus Latescibacterota bacterium]|nr:MAG: phosphate ABC transporter substrate-binding protein [Candidatus Latescibacterota bacterium]RLB38504.1 MAG: phosphate ABC transporter substrate-binding protein [Deltaproteobacteria bacterium]